MDVTVEPHPACAREPFTAPGLVSNPPLRILAFVEARGVTGTVKLLLQFKALAATAVSPADLEFVTFRRPSGRGAPAAVTHDVDAFIAAARQSGVTTHVLHERCAGDPRLFPQIRSLIRRLRPDIVETHHVKSHFLAAATGAGVAYPWVAFHHGYTATTRKDRAYNLLDRWSLRRATAIVTGCRAFADELAGFGITRPPIAVVHSSVDPRGAGQESRRSARARLQLADDAAVVVAVGRLSREKAHAQLVAAFATGALGRIARAVLVIVGDGPERSRLERLARALGVADRVCFAGYQANVSVFYDAADVVALPSDSEGSPNVLLEAMAAGRPVVATSVGGVPEIIENRRTGLLAPPRQPGALGAALATVLEDPVLACALGRAARTEVARRFTPAVRAAALLAVYQQVCPR